MFIKLPVPQKTHTLLISVSSRRALIGGVNNRRVERRKESGNVPKSFNKQNQAENRFVGATDWRKPENTCWHEKIKSVSVIAKLCVFHSISVPPEFPRPS
jgi:hypothetical protein